MTEQVRKEQEVVGQATIRDAREANPSVEEEAEVEIPLVRKRRRLNESRGYGTGKRSCTRKWCQQGTGPNRGRRREKQEKTCQLRRDRVKG